MRQSVSPDIGSPEAEQPREDRREKRAKNPFLKHYFARNLGIVEWYYSKAGTVARGIAIGVPV